MIFLMPSLRVKQKAGEKTNQNAHSYTFILFFTNVNPHSLIPRAEGKKTTLSVLKCSKGKFLSDFKFQQPVKCRNMIQQKKAYNSI